MSDDSSTSERQTSSRRKMIKKPTANSSEHDVSVPSKKSTKMMVQEALVQLKDRKGVSYYAIKKYIQVNYNVDINKIKHLIKRYLKTGVEVGTILQMKGTGASGSFKLVKVEKEKSVKAKKKKKTADASNKIKKSSGGESKKSAADVKKKSAEVKKKTAVTKKTAGDVANKSADGMKKPVKAKKSDKSASEKTTKIKKVKGDVEGRIAKKIKEGTSKDVKTPSKKKALMMRRKSIGSIIKPPKMKPKAM